MRSTALAVAAALGVLFVWPACATDPAPPKPPPSTPAWPGARVLVGPRFVAEGGDVGALVLDKEGRIVGLYDDDRQLSPALPRTRLPGAVAFPGMHDAHLHALGIGIMGERADLVGSTSPAEVVGRMQAFLSAHPDVTVVYGRGWDQSRFADAAFPSVRDLDAFVEAGERPVLLTRVDGHALWVNRAALALAGIDRTTPDPDGGSILKDEAGEPTGILVDNAMALVREKLPPPADADLERWWRSGLAAAADAGLVAGHEMGISAAAWAALLRLDATEELPIRVFAYLDGAEEAVWKAFEGPRQGRRVVLLGVKLLADGAMGSRGAALLEPYSDAPESRGLLVTEPKLLEERARRAHALGGQVAIHAIGDRGVREAISALAAAEGADRSRRHRIEHAQLVDDDDFAAFGRLGLVASMQPTHATSDMRWAEARLGAARLKGAYAWRRILDLGVPLAFGSDGPIESYRPTDGVYAAVTRQDAEGQPPGGWRPDQRLTEDEAVAAFTRGAAWAVHREADLGRLAVGYLADLTLLSPDPRGDPAAWRTAAVAGTVVEGQLRGARGAP